MVQFATSVVPPNKVYVGIHFYGQDWGTESCASVTWESAQERLQTYGTARQWQENAGWRRTVAEPWFTYANAGHYHQVWYADAESVQARLGLVQTYGLGGSAVWRLGGEDPVAWDAIASALRAGTAGP